MSRKHDLKPSTIDGLELTQGDREIIKRLRDKLSSESVVSHKFSEEQKKLMEAWYKNLLSHNPSIVETYIAPNGRSLAEEIDAFGKFLLEKIFVGDDDLRLLSQLRSLSKDPSLVAISISGFNDNPDRIFSYLVDGAMSDLMRVHDSQDVTENHKHIFIDPRQLDVRNFGQVGGVIEPHADDLYKEDERVDVLTLTTVCNETGVPTELYSLNNIMQKIEEKHGREYADKYLLALYYGRATFRSGVNVGGAEFTATHDIISFNGDVVDWCFDMRFFGDQQRMYDIQSCHEDGLISHKMVQDAVSLVKEVIYECEPIKGSKATGDFIAVANMKAAHARIQKVTPTEAQLKNQEDGRGFRDLYRSKGSQHRASSFKEWKDRVGTKDQRAQDEGGADRDS
jgi:hypothetical protein